jgi:membrane-associated phospholipid phosphatase
MKMNESDHRKFWGWPGASNLAYAYFVLGIPSFAWFAFVYAGADYWTGRHQYRVPLYHSVELSIPLIPATTIFYNSLHLIYAVAPFILRNRGEMNGLAVVWFLMTLVGGICFLVIPFEPGFPPPDPASMRIWRGMYEFADSANLRFNCCPSLHVAWGVATLDIYARSATQGRKALLWSWAAGLSLSTLFLHQHHVIDVIGGLGLAIWGSRVVYPGFYGRNLLTH